MNVFRFWPRDTSSCSCCICRSRLEASAHRAALAQAATEEHQVISSGENRQRTIHFSCSSATAQALPEIFECSVLRLGHSHPLKSLKGWTAVPESSPSHIPSSLSLSLSLHDALSSFKSRISAAFSWALRTARLGTTRLPCAARLDESTTRTSSARLPALSQCLDSCQKHGGTVPERLSHQCRCGSCRRSTARLQTPLLQQVQDS